MTWEFRVYVGQDSDTCRVPRDINVGEWVDRWVDPSPGPGIVPAVLAAAGTDSHLCTGPCVRLALATGTRRGELLGLRSRDIDRRHRRVWIGRTVPRALKGQLVTKEMRRSAQAWVTVNGDTLDHLDALRKLMAERALAVGTPLDGDRFVFSAEATCRRPFDPSPITHAWSRIREQAGAQMRLHDLRHFSATYLLGQSVPLPEVSARLRHAHTSTTVQFYAVLRLTHRRYGRRRDPSPRRPVRSGRARTR